MAARQTNSPLPVPTSSVTFEKPAYFRRNSSWFICRLFLPAATIMSGSFLVGAKRNQEHGAVFCASQQTRPPDSARGRWNTRRNTRKASSPASIGLSWIMVTRLPTRPFQLCAVGTPRCAFGLHGAIHVPPRQGEEGRQNGENLGTYKGAVWMVARFRCMGILGRPVTFATRPVRMSITTTP